MKTKQFRIYKYLLNNYHIDTLDELSKLAKFPNEYGQQVLKQHFSDNTITQLLKDYYREIETIIFEIYSTFYIPKPFHSLDINLQKVWLQKTVTFFAYQIVDKFPICTRRSVVELQSLRHLYKVHVTTSTPYQSELAKEGAKNRHPELISQHPELTSKQAEEPNNPLAAELAKEQEKNIQLLQALNASSRLLCEIAIKYFSNKQHASLPPIMAHLTHFEEEIAYRPTLNVEKLETLTSLVTQLLALVKNQKNIIPIIKELQTFKEAVDRHGITHVDQLLEIITQIKCLYKIVINQEKH